MILLTYLFISAIASLFYGALTYIFLGSTWAKIIAAVIFVVAMFWLMVLGGAGIADERLEQ